GNADLSLDPVARHQTGMVAGTTGHDVNVLDVPQASLGIRPQNRRQYMILTQSTGKRVVDGARLLEDFLEHVMAILALVQAQRRMFITLGGPLYRLAPGIPDLAAV